MDFSKIELLINKKENAEAYKSEINNLDKELEEIKRRRQLTIVKEEKDMLEDERVNKESKKDEYNRIYKEKVENIEKEILEFKEAELQRIQELENKKISRDEMEKIKAKREEMKEESKQYEEYIEKARIEWRSKEVITTEDKKDKISLAKKINNYEAVKENLNEEIKEIDNKLKDFIVIEENIEQIKEMDYQRMRLSNLSYGSLEQWLENEKEFQKESIHETELEEKKTESVQKEPIKVKPKKVEQNKTDAIKVKPKKVEPIVTNPIKVKIKEQPNKIKTEETKPEETKPNRTKIEKKEPRKIDPKLNHELVSFFHDQKNDENFGLTGKEKLDDTEKKENVAKIRSVLIDPLAEDSIKYSLINSSNEISDCAESKLRYNDQEIIDIKNSLKSKGMDLGDIVSAVDPNITKLIIEKSSDVDSGLEEYFNLLKGKESSIESIKYNLKGVYKSDLTIEEIKRIEKIAKAAQKANADKINIKQDNILLRKFGELKKRYQQYRQKRIEAKNGNKREIKGFHNVRKFFTKEPKMVSKIKELSSRVSTNVKSKLSDINSKMSDSRKDFANKLKVDVSPIKIQNEEKDEEKQINIKEGVNKLARYTSAKISGIAERGREAVGTKLRNIKGFRKLTNKDRVKDETVKKEGKGFEITLD